MRINANKFINNAVFTIALCISALAMIFMQEPYNISLLGWVALVPLVVASLKLRVDKWLLLTSYLILSAYWTANVYWIGYISTAGWIMVSLVLGVYWPFSIAALKYLHSKKMPLPLALPLVWIGAQSWQGFIMGGFNWGFLGHSQYQNLHMIQIADIFGEPAVSFIVAMVNGMIASLFTYKITRKTFFEASITIITLCAVWIYGDITLKSSKSTISQGPLVGIIQPNVASSDKEEMSNAMKIVDDMMALSQEAIDAGAQIIVWPETMVLGIINKEYLIYCNKDGIDWQLHRKISKFANNRCNLLVGSLSADVAVKDGEFIIANQYNSAFLYQKDSKQFTQRYDKRYLVPFGEYIPLASNKFIRKILMHFVPYDYDYSLTPGKHYTVFTIKDDKKVYKFATMICYEDTDPKTVRKLSYSKKRNSKQDWLFDISNDGWYVKFDEAGMHPSSELSQRTAINVFRAVENHIAIARSVNTGISCIIDSNGKIRDTFKAATLAHNFKEREAVSGWLVDNIPIDTRVTIFSIVGLWYKWIFILIYPILAIAGFFLIKNNNKSR